MVPVWQRPRTSLCRVSAPEKDAGRLERPVDPVEGPVETFRRKDSELIGAAGHQRVGKLEGPAERGIPAGAGEGYRRTPLRRQRIGEFLGGCRRPLSRCLPPRPTAGRGTGGLATLISVGAWLYALSAWWQNRRLAADLGLAKGTVVKAYEMLESEAVIATRGRKGSFVLGPAANSTADRVAGLAPPIDALVVTAKQLGADLDEVRAALDRAWDRF